MRGFIAVVEREIYERRLLGVVALFLGLAAIVLPLVPGLRPGGVSVEDLRSGMAVGFALLLGALLAVFLGSSILAGELVERRLGFYFARPLSGRVIWAGKIAAALTLILGAGALILAPAALTGGGLSLSGMWGTWFWNLSGVALIPLAVAGLLFLLLAAHAASVVVRARSPWVILDIVALGLVVLLIDGSFRRLIDQGIYPTQSVWDGSRILSETGVTAWLFWALLPTVFLALAIAGAAQVIHGRTDARRGHRILSATLWGILLAAAILSAAFASWVLAAGPRDLRNADRLVAAPAGTWIALSGPALHRPGYHPSFLYDFGSGRWTPARFGHIATFYDDVEPAVRFSADGRRAVWLDYEGLPRVDPVIHLYRMDLDRPGARPVRTTTTFDAMPGSLALSPDGRLLAFYHWSYKDRSGRVIVQETVSERLLASIRYESVSSRPRLVFTPAGRLRLYEASMIRRPGFPAEIRESPDGISEIDLSSPSPRVEPTGRMPSARGSGWSLDVVHDRALLRGKAGLLLCDGRTGALLARVGEPYSYGYFLTDGRIAVLDRALNGARALRLLTEDGRSELRRWDFGGARGLVPAGQPSPGRLRVVVSATGSPGGGWDLRELDLESGASRSLGRRSLIYPTHGRDGQPTSSLAGADGILWYDPVSLQERVLLKG